MAATEERTEALRALVREVASAIQAIDERMLDSDYIKHEVLGLQKGTSPTGYGYDDLEVYSEDLDTTRFLERHLASVLRNFIIECLAGPATRPDHYCPLLAAAYGAVHNDPARSIQVLEKRRAVLNGFLNSAEVALEVYDRETDTTPSFRRRRPRIGAAATETEPRRLENTQSSDSERDAQEAISSRPRMLGKLLLSGFISNSTLIALVTLFTTAASILAAYGYRVATERERERERDVDPSWGSAEFYNTAQGALMQLLGLYVTVQPALRHGAVRSSYTRWSWLLAALGAAAPFLAVGYFRRGPDASQLVLFVGSAIQSTIVLQLIWAVDNMERKRR
ncbi:hypothetical protein F5Y14DRAFT_448772 [Nemania sp. NC0429]|nr:hypothetical protein F5Y14DRAFT_448772 [Nemania sp. NC0429]